MASLIGKKIGPYVVQAEIGAGGMAVVYKAEQPSLERLVAVKELRGDLGKDKSLVARFEREAKYVAALAHQNIVHIYDFITRANAMYIVMEFVDGIDVHTLLARGPRMPPDVAAVIALQAARALEYAHFRNVVHRDFKPSNLMITRHGDVKLMDFGIARDSSYEDPSLTRPGIALGTPAYMSPEQILGERVDFRSDIFSFGIVLYQLLTGDKPFAEDDTRSVMNHILHQTYRTPRALYPDIPMRLQRIVRRCLQKRPNDRYSRTELLRRDLEEFVTERVPLNANGRLVTYLFNNKVIDETAAKAVLSPEFLTSPRHTDIDRGTVDGTAAVLRPVFQFNMAALFAMAAWAAWVATGNVTGPMGYLHVSAQPWAEVYIDGTFYNTTPMPTVQVKPGPHRVEFRNRSYQSATQNVQVAPGKTTRVAVELSKSR